MDPRQLPVWALHEPIVESLRHHGNLVLVAATGSGKTTQVPQMLLDAGVARGKRIVVLQPRRVAARTVASRVAWERGGKLGGEVGYQVRFEDHIAHKAFSVHKGLSPSDVVWRVAARAETETGGGRKFVVISWDRKSMYDMLSLQRLARRDALAKLPLGAPRAG